MRPRSQSHLQPSNFFKRVTSFVPLELFLLVVSLNVTESGSGSLVKTLPGLPDDIPFTLETGYIGVGESEDLQLFYYFFESEGNPRNDPLILWLAGGPGCSGLYGIIYEIGPFTFNYKISTLEKQKLELNPYSWTKAANIIFVDQPAGSGYSYAKTHEAYITNDTLSAIHVYQFLTKWLVDHPNFLDNPLYVAASSYSGILVPMIVEKVYNGNEVGEGPYINIKGYMLGNPATDTHAEYNSRIQYAHRMALLSDAIYRSTKKNCYGEYTIVDLNNKRCLHDLQVVNKCLERIYMAQILEPYCDNSKTIKSNLSRRGLRSFNNTSMDIRSLTQVQFQGCREDHYLYSDPWANSKEVQEALHVREEFSEIKWVLCNDTLRFYIDREPISNTHDVWNTVAYHRRLTHKNCRALVYSGDHDLTVPHFSTLNWIESLNLLVVDDWRPWFVEEQIAGYTVKHSNQNYNLTFATLKGAGHTGPEFKPKEGLNMITRWLAYEDL